eukprot:352265-Chlamydomonas_euryale.AAC.4
MCPNLKLSTRPNPAQHLARLPPGRHAPMAGGDIGDGVLVLFMVQRDAPQPNHLGPLKDLLVVLDRDLEQQAASWPLKKLNICSSCPTAPSTAGRALEGLGCGLWGVGALSSACVIWSSNSASPGYPTIESTTCFPALSKASPPTLADANAPQLQ